METDGRSITPDSLRNMGKKKDPKTMTDRELEIFLNPKQRLFCVNYLKYNNIKEAAIQAGYAEKSAMLSGSNLLKKNPYAIEYIARGYEKLQTQTIADANEILQYLTDVMRGQIKDQFGLEASLAERTKAAQELAKRQIDMPAKLAEAENFTEVKFTFTRRQTEVVGDGQ